MQLSNPLNWLKTFQIWKWKKKLAINKHVMNLNKISFDINGFALSKQARINQDAFEYVYGEIDITSFLALISLTGVDCNTVFYDLGSGAGKTVLACSMVFPVKKSCGIELFNELHSAAELQKERLMDLGYQPIAEKIEFIHGSFLTTSFKDATLIYINATGYFGETWSQLNRCLEQLPQPLTVITTTKSLQSSAFKIEKITHVQMSWGIVKSYIHKKMP